MLERARTRPECLLHSEERSKIRPFRSSTSAFLQLWTQLFKINDVISKHIVKNLSLNLAYTLIFLQKLLTFFQQKYLRIRYCTY